MASLISYNRSGILASRSASGHHTARKETSQSPSTVSRTYAHLPSFPSRRTSGCRTSRLRIKRRLEVQQIAYKRSAIPRHRIPLRAGSMDLRLGTAGWGRLQSGQRSIAWSTSFLWKNVLHQQRKVDSARTPGGGRGALQVAVRSGDLQAIDFSPKFSEQKSAPLPLFLPSTDRFLTPSLSFLSGS